MIMMMGIMIRLSKILILILCAAATLVAATVSDTKATSPRTELVLGSDKIALIRDNYEQGKYDAFFEKVDLAYQQADLDGLIALRKPPANLPNDDWAKPFLELEAKKNQDLLDAVSDLDDSALAAKVRNVASNSTTDSQQEAFVQMDRISLLAPGTGINEDENTLIDIDLEYMYKDLQARLPADDVSPEQRAEHLIALHMQRAEKMEKASEKFQDHSLKQAVILCVAHLDTRLSKSLDAADLCVFAEWTTIKTATRLEKDVAFILNIYHSDLQNLMKTLSN